jgi:type I restriction enzyme S subunit
MTNSNWSEVILRDLADVKHGFAFQGEFFTDKETQNILLTPGNFAIGGGYKGDKLKYYLGEVPEDYVLNRHDVIVTMTDLSKNMDTLGYSALVPENNGKRFLHNQRLGKVLIKDKKKLDKYFLYYLLRTTDYRNEILASASGSVIKHTSPDRIKNYKFLLPLLPEQRAIAGILGALDDKIEVNRRMNVTLESMARAVFAGMMNDESGRMNETTIGEVVTIVGGSTPSTINSAFWNNGDIHWATPKDLAPLQSPFLLETNSQITELGLQEISSGLLPVGTVLLSSRAPIGYLAITQIPTAINQGFIAIKCTEEVPNYFMLNWLKVNMEEIIGRANGTTFLEISKSNFRPMKIFVPSPEKMKEFVVTVEPLYQKVVANLKESCTLASLRDSLLPKLMRGEVRVKDVRSN